MRVEAALTSGWRALLTWVLRHPESFAMDWGGTGASERSDEGSLLGGSWVVINGVIIRVTMLISHIRGLITPLIIAHKTPSTPPGGSELAVEESTLASFLARSHWFDSGGLSDRLPRLALKGVWSCRHAGYC